MADVAKVTGCLGGYPEALLSLPADDRKSVIGWLQDCAKDARYAEPDVGIFANRNMADAFDALAAIVEDAAPATPAGALATTPASDVSA
jgi:hypothetical protein